MSQASDWATRLQIVKQERPSAFRSAPSDRAERQITASVSDVGQAMIETNGKTFWLDADVAAQLGAYLVKVFGS